MGEEAIRYARSYALEAERKMGELLREREQPKGGEQYHKEPTGNVMSPVLPTLAELGLTKRESAEAQRLAALPQEAFEAVKAGEKTLTETSKQGVLLVGLGPENQSWSTW